nr:TPA_asm: M25 uORF 1 RNA *1 [Murid betaherpesvirus 1]DBA07744.1 TPA_asm: M25 uORF 1 RNA *1 [Murid betaherpesvirus 1]
MGPAVQ